MTKLKREHEIYKQAKRAWSALKKRSDWSHWTTIGEALLIGRTKAMKQAQTNKPEGSRYNAIFGQWLKDIGLQEIDKGTRSRLLACMDDLPSINAYLDALPLAERLTLNHPNSIHRRWRALDHGGKHTARKREGTKDLRARIAELQAELEEKDYLIAELEEEARNLRRELNGDFTPAVVREQDAAA